jgi:hypothetical protein
MKTFVFWLMALLVLCLGLAVPSAAEVVGKITQVEGRVDFLKAGKLPALQAKLDDGVEVGDVLRTKSLSKAQITFMDNTVITVSPEARIAIEDYMFDPGQGKRSAVLQLFQGLAHVVVSKLYKVAEPDFVVKTNTAVMGVRGTDFGLRIEPDSSTILNFEGKTEVGNIYPEVGDLLFKKADKIAYSWGGGNTVLLVNMQGTTVYFDKPPTLPFSISDYDRQFFMHQVRGEFVRSGQGTTPGGPTGYVALGGGDIVPVSYSAPGSLSPGTNTSKIFTSFSIPQPITYPPNWRGYTSTPPPSPSPPTYSFTETYTGDYQLTSTTENVGVYTNNPPGFSGGMGTRTGVYSGSFTTLFTLTGTGPSFASSNTGTFTASTISGTVSGTLGQPLTGTIIFQNASTSGGTLFNFSGQVTISPNGNLTVSNLAGTITLGETTGTLTGTWVQTPSTTSTTTSTTVVTASRLTSPPVVTANSSSPTPVVNADPPSSPRLSSHLGQHMAKTVLGAYLPGHNSGNLPVFLARLSHAR